MSEARKRITALEELKRVVEESNKLHVAAEHLLEVCNKEKRPVVEEECFYLTLDSSMVYTLRKVGACRCLVCTGQTEPSLFEMLGLVVPGISLAQFRPANSADDESSGLVHVQEEKEEEKNEFQVVIIRGGHGIKDLSGEEPGDKYQVNKEGWVVFNTTTSNRIVTPSSIAICGLSLWKKITVKAMCEE